MSRLLGFSVPSVFDAAGPLVFAHRGGAKIGPENTIVAFRRGLAAGADGVECDVRLSRDGEAVVIHDATLERTTDRTGPVAALTAGELATVDATSRFSPHDATVARPPREGVPTLAEVLRLSQVARVIIEIKDDNTRLAEAVATAVASAGAESRVCIGSFHGAVLHHVRRVAPALTTSASLSEATRTLWRSWIGLPRVTRAPYRAFQVPPSTSRYRVVSPTFVRQVHREQAVVQVWTVDTPDEVRTLLDMGVDGVISDRPDLAVPARDAWVRARRDVPRAPAAQ